MPKISAAAVIRKAAPFWIEKQGLFALAIPGDALDGWHLRLKIGRREFESETSFVRLRDAEKAAEAIWQQLCEGP